MKRSVWLKDSEQRLEKAGISNARFEVRVLFSLAPENDPAAFPAGSGDELNEAQLAILERWMARREKHESVWRILGKRGFWKSDFILNEATLEPRPDTETLIETALEFMPDTSERIRILDLGTGTGCILLSLLQEYTAATGIGTDQSAKALEAAKENATALKLTDRAQFMQTNWADGISEAFQLIVSNPPYIPAKTIEGLDQNVRGFDPLKALDGGEDGLDAYRALAKLAPKHLALKGLCIIEIGQGQEEQVADLFEAEGLKMSDYRRDLNGIIRALVFSSKD
jgi:release factor glutamine methyltransferase